MRKPRLYEAGTLTFTNNGLGSLIDAQDGEVKRAFGAMELEMKYPVKGRLFRDLTYQRIVLAEPGPGEEPQPFYIYRITKPMNGLVTVYAKHVCYQLDGKPVRPFTASTATEAMQKLKSHAMTVHPFSFETDVGRSGSFKLTKPAATWAVLGGTEGSILDIFHGEYEFDRYTVRLLTRRGQDRGVRIRYGKNLRTLEQDANCAGCYTGVVPYWVDTATGESIYAEPVLAEGNFGYSRVLPVDFTEKFETKPTIQQLTERAEKYIRDNDIGVPNVSLKVQFVPLEQTEEYAHLAKLEQVSFGDTVTVEFPKLDIDVSARVVETRYDFLRGRYKDVTIGKVKQSLADLIVNQQKQVSAIPQGTALQIALAQATAAILGARGGAVRLLDTDGDGMQDTIYVADHADPAQAVKVWRWNYEGWGVSKTGYNGPFVMAATLEGGFAAEFITSGKIDTERLDVDELSVAIAKVIQLTADSITTGKLSADRLDVENLVVQALRAVETREDGFQGIVKTDTGHVRLFSFDGSVEREVIDLGVVNTVTSNFATNHGKLDVRSFREGVEDYRISIEGDSIYTFKSGEALAGWIQGHLQYFGDGETVPIMGLGPNQLHYTLGDHRANFGIEETGGFARIASLYPTGTGNMEWKYIAAIGQTVLVKKS